MAPHHQIVGNSGSPAEFLLDLLVHQLFLTVDASLIDTMNHLGRVADPTGDLGHRHAGVQPRRDACVPQVVRPPPEDGRLKVRREREFPSVPPHAPIGATAYQTTPLVREELHRARRPGPRTPLHRVRPHPHAPPGPSPGPPTRGRGPPPARSPRDTGGGRQALDPGRVPPSGRRVGAVVQTVAEPRLAQTFFTSSRRSRRAERGGARPGASGRRSCLRPAPARPPAAGRPPNGDGVAEEKPVVAGAVGSAALATSPRAPAKSSDGPVTWDFAGR